jgi:hypothetical protein
MSKPSRNLFPAQFSFEVFGVGVFELSDVERFEIRESLAEVLEMCFCD